jgi:hypothetical protein
MVHSIITGFALAGIIIICSSKSGVGVAQGFSYLFDGSAIIGRSSSSMELRSQSRRETLSRLSTRQRRGESFLHGHIIDDDCNYSYSAIHTDTDNDTSDKFISPCARETNKDIIIINNSSNISSSRHHFLSSIASTLLLPALLATTTVPNPSYALVKGNAPPPKMKPSGGSSTGGNANDGITAPKCRNVEECQEMAERAEVALMQREAEKAASGPKPQIVNGRTRYLDVMDDDDNDSVDASARRVAKVGDSVTIYYRVLKLGKRSYDGLSGEGTVVFSRGYALEDDEKVVGDKSFTFVLGDRQVIQALNDAIPGMSVGSTRRISVTPQGGWEKNTPSCDGGPGGKGVGGELRTDYVVVPTATMVEQEACFDRSKLPFPSTYAQERRMAQRFDQSLIVEVKLVNAL